ncbi:hypothetical protein JTB14_021396 [Gonioctena quinquepunctata]|nr:hypothetical protein JTB14_021396 [Gonioctena quinquepunctata]
MKNKDNLTLQEYLRRNRPDFIDSAEFRRQAVVNSQTERQLTKDELKLKFIEENEQNIILRVPNKLFSEKEMREITRRNYKKLPEVQQRLNNFREQRLRNADKLC